MDAEQAAWTALYRGDGNTLADEAACRDVDAERLWIIGYARAQELIEDDRAPDQGYLVVSARNAMRDAMRRIYAVDAGSRSVTEEDCELHNFLRPTWRDRSAAFLDPYRQEPERERNLSDDGYRAANEILTPKERKVIDGTLTGKTQEEIAEELDHQQPWISKLYRRSIRKLTGSGHSELEALGRRLQVLGRETRRAAL